MSALNLKNFEPEKKSSADDPGPTAGKLFIIKAGDTFPDLIPGLGNFETWIKTGLDRDESLIRIINAENGDTLPEPEQVGGAVISGSHSMVTQDLAWSLDLEKWTRKIIRAGRPLLGICYGHQIIARAMGGQVDFHPKGTEIGTKEIFCRKACLNDPLFRVLPEKFKVHLFHSQSVTRLPPEALLLAHNDYEPHQAFRIGKNAWGVQFHPEASKAVTIGYIKNLAETVEKEGQDTSALIRMVEETTFAAALLKRFGELVVNQE